MCSIEGTQDERQRVGDHRQRADRLDTDEPPGGAVPHHHGDRAHIHRRQLEVPALAQLPHVGQPLLVGEVGVDGVAGVGEHAAVRQSLEHVPVEAGVPESLLPAGRVAGVPVDHRRTRALTGGTGAVTDRYNYDAFGRLLNQSGGTVNSYLFAGQQTDATTALRASKELP